MSVHTCPGYDPTSGEVALLDAVAARQGDRAAVDAGDTWAGLMDRAAAALAGGVIALAGRAYGLRVAMVVGKGNNGGDGWAAAARLRDRGAQVRVVAPQGLDAPGSAEAEANRARWLASGGWASGDPGAVAGVLAWADVAVDALLGTGSIGAPRGVVADAVKALVDAHRAGMRVVACDVPSGVSADDGKCGDGTVETEAVIADLTVTFGGMKRGLLLHPGCDHAGRVVVGPLGPRYQPLPVRWHALTAAGAASGLLARDAEKRDRGIVLAVAGGQGTAGAAALCGQAAVVGGAGLVTVATPQEAQPTVAGLVPAAMTRPLPSGEGASVGETPRRGVLAAQAVDELRDAEAFDVVVAGPGLGLGAGVRAVVDHLRMAAHRLVLDADALNVYREDPAPLAEHRGPLVVTPHARELARLAQRPDAGRHRAEVAITLARRLQATVVAKGPATVVAAPDGRVWVTPVGSPSLATGGTGDVLAGLIAAAVATADDVPRAAAQAVWRHAYLGDVLGGEQAGRLTAQQLPQHYLGVMAELGDLARRRPMAPFGRDPR